MSSKNVSKDVLSVVKKKTGNTVNENDIFKLASEVKPSTIQSDAQLRQLIKQVAGLVNVPVSEDTMNELIGAIQTSNLNVNNVEQLMKMMEKK